VICGVAIARLKSLVDEINQASTDLTWSDAYPHLWTAIETSLGVVVACLPHMMPVMQRISTSLGWRTGTEPSAYRRESYTAVDLSLRTTISGGGKNNRLYRSDTYASYMSSRLAEDARLNSTYSGSDAYGNDDKDSGITAVERQMAEERKSGHSSM
jgi:hypothetical protein